MFHGKSASLATNQVILIDGDRIAVVGPNVAIPSDAVVIDLSGATVLPAMIKRSRPQYMPRIAAGGSVPAFAAG